MLLWHGAYTERELKQIQSARICSHFKIEDPPCPDIKALKTSWYSDSRLASSSVCSNLTLRPDTRYWYICMDRSLWSFWTMSESVSFRCYLRARDSNINSNFTFRYLIHGLRGAILHTALTPGLWGFSVVIFSFNLTSLLARLAFGSTTRM